MLHFSSKFLFQIASGQNIFKTWRCLCEPWPCWVSWPPPPRCTLSLSTGRFRQTQLRAQARSNLRGFLPILRRRERSQSFGCAIVRLSAHHKLAHHGGSSGLHMDGARASKECACHPLLFTANPAMLADAPPHPHPPLFSPYSSSRVWRSTGDRAGALPPHPIHWHDPL